MNRLRTSRREGVPIVKGLVDLIRKELAGRATLLAVCPNSETVTRAALLAAREADSPILFAATLNQVDIDGGYTGWTPASFVDFLTIQSDLMDVRSPVLACLDHGGPWLKDRHTTENYSYERTMSELKQSLEACIDAGYALLHIDPTVDRSLPSGVPISIDIVVDRSVELIEYAESYRVRRGLGPISYEVGTEEVHGGLADLTMFDHFLKQLKHELDRRNLADAWPCFVVGKVGTDLHTTFFDPEIARVLTESVRPYGALIKGHYTDSVHNPEDYPLAGIGGANVGPEFTEEEYSALLELVALERKLGCHSDLEAAVRRAVVESGRWTKWLHPDEKGQSFDELSADRQQWLLRTGSRYIWTRTAVQEARMRLYNNLQDHRNADEYVLWRIKTAILKYFNAFNLINLNKKCAELWQGPVEAEA